MTLAHNTKITPDLVKSHGLKPDEYERFVKLLGREPTITELGICSAMWNEHCSYKSSKKWLKTMPTKGARVIQGPGENAGVIDIGDGDAIVFKMESHNHPSFIEPYQGAATGVGGILRDVFTMGARPIAAMNALRFGELDGLARRTGCDENSHALIVTWEGEAPAEPDPNFSVPSSFGSAGASAAGSVAPAPRAVSKGARRSRDRERFMVGRRVVKGKESRGTTGASFWGTILGSG